MCTAHSSTEVNNESMDAREEEVVKRVELGVQDVRTDSIVVSCHYAVGIVECLDSGFGEEEMRIEIPGTPEPVATVAIQTTMQLMRRTIGRLLRIGRAQLNNDRSVQRLSLKEYCLRLTNQA